MPKRLPPKNSSWVQLTKDFVKEWPEVLEGLHFQNMPVKYLLYIDIILKNNITIHYDIAKELKIKKQEHQEILDDLAKAVQEHASDLDMGFDVFTKIGLRFKEGLTREVVLRRIENALDMKVPYNYLKINDNCNHSLL